ncbi:MAG: hypothetical protein IMF19_11360, partial [Proteobacteria bacterium]|nr:hypothetical protein [Pseudomonadota bacterium]
DNFTPAFKDRIGKTMVLSSIARGDLVEMIRKRTGDNNPFTSEAMIILAERYNSPRRLLEGCTEVCIYCAEEGLSEVTEAVVEGYITRQKRQLETRQKEGEMVDDGAIRRLQSGGTAEEDMTKKRQTIQPETIQKRQPKRQKRQLETRQKEEVVRSDEPTTGLKNGDTAEEDMKGKRQTTQPETIQRIQKRQDVRLSPEQQKIADLVGREVNTVKEIAKELDMGEAATRTQIKRMIEKGCVELVSSERPKKYGLKE